MTKSEMDYMDSSLLGPFLMFMNQYFNTPVAEHYLLYFSLVSRKNFKDHSDIIIIYLLMIYTF